MAVCIGSGWFEFVIERAYFVVYFANKSIRISLVVLCLRILEDSSSQYRDLQQSCQNLGSFQGSDTNVFQIRYAVPEISMVVNTSSFRSEVSSCQRNQLE